MSWLQIAIALLGTLLGGGLIGALFRFLLDSRKLTNVEQEAVRTERRDEFKIIVDLVVKQRDEAYETINDMRIILNNLEMEVQGLRLARDLDPFPHWVIDLQGLYLFVNREFEKQFLEPKGWNYRDMIGKSSDSIWPKPFCTTLDMLASQSRSRPDGRARGTTSVDRRKVTVNIFPVRVQAVPVAYAGYITDIEELDAIEGGGERQ